MNNVRPTTARQASGLREQRSLCIITSSPLGSPSPPLQRGGTHVIHKTLRLWLTNHLAPDRTFHRFFPAKHHGHLPVVSFVGVPELAAAFNPKRYLSYRYAHPRPVINACSSENKTHVDSLKCPQQHRVGHATLGREPNTLRPKRTSVSSSPTSGSAPSRLGNIPPAPTTAFGSRVPRGTWAQAALRSSGLSIHILYQLLVP